MLPEVMPLGGTVHLCILGVAAAMIFLYNSPGKNIFLNIGLGLWDSYNMATGLLGDVLSYVRLFALGLSGGILAGVFNSLAVGMSPDNVIAGPIVMVLIFVIGHAINIFYERARCNGSPHASDFCGILQELRIRRRRQGIQAV